MSPVRCDLVVPVYNALRSTRDCLESVRRFAPSWARVVVINDGSDARTTEWLREQEGLLLLENPVNLGFVKTANRGLLFSDAPFVCLLNSDTLLTEGALERMVARLSEDPSIALCCPVSNEAVNLSVKIPPGSDVFSFGRRVARTSPALYPDAVTVVGFCLLFRREVIRTLGVFDEVFERGYCEETDYHYRCRAAGWRCVVADDAFVYHRHGASFTDRDVRLARNMEILMGRWRRLHEEEIAAFDRRNALGAVRDAAYEWRLPDDAPEERDLLFVLPSLQAPIASPVLQLANTLLLSGTRVGVALLDGGALPVVETFLRPIVVSPERLGEVLASTRAVVATDTATAAAVALAAVGAGRPPAGLIGVPASGDDPVRDLYRARASFLPAEGAALVPLSPEPDLFYPRAVARARVAVREPLGAGLDEECFATLPREKRAALFGAAAAVVDLAGESAATALEAMASGAVPVLARGSAGALVANEETALFVDAAEPAAALRAVRALLADSGDRSRRAAAGLVTARSRTWQAAAGAFSAWIPTLEPLALPDEARRAALQRLVASRPRPAAPSPEAAVSRSPLRSRLGRLRRLLARV